MRSERTDRCRANSGSARREAERVWERDCSKPSCQRYQSVHGDCYVRTCTKCGESKALDEFWADRSKKHGKTARCKACKTATFNAYRKERGYDKRRYANNRDSERERHLIRKYGVTLSMYEEMLAAQGGCCAICGKAQKRSFDVDHCHQSGRVRGLLCTSCNRMLGHSGDNPDVLRRAADYLGSSRKSRPSSSAHTAK